MQCRKSEWPSEHVEEGPGEGGWCWVGDAGGAREAASQGTSLVEQQVENRTENITHDTTRDITLTKISDLFFWGFWAFLATEEFVAKKLSVRETRLV